MEYPHPYFWEIEITTIPATAGNVEYNLQPPAGYKYLILSLVVTIVCDGTAANRKVEIRIEDGSGNVLFGAIRNATAYTAGQTRVISLIRKLVRNLDLETSGINSLAEIGDSFLLSANTRLNIDIDAGVAGDSYSGYITYLKIRA